MNEPASLQGQSFDCADPEARVRAIELAFDYRGDVTLQLLHGAELVGYLANRDFEAEQPFVEFHPATGEPPRRLPVDRIVRIAFTGVDTASGKSWENWLRKVEEAKARGEIAELYPEAADLT